MSLWQRLRDALRREPVVDEAEADRLQARQEHHEGDEPARRSVRRHYYEEASQPARGWIPPQ